MMSFLVQMKQAKSGEGCSLWPNWRELNKRVQRELFQAKKDKHFFIVFLLLACDLHGPKLLAHFLCLKPFTHVSSKQNAWRLLQDKAFHLPPIRVRWSLRFIPTLIFWFQVISKRKRLLERVRSEKVKHTLYFLYCYSCLRPHPRFGWNRKWQDL